MPFLDTVRVVLDETLGNRGAVRNCRTELRRRQEAERAVRQLCERIPPVVASAPVRSEDPVRASA